jgi:hypothetical protein
MLYRPEDGQQIFEVEIYNRDVRSLVKQNQSHSYFDDFWADVQVQSIIACNEVEARNLISSKFPSDAGFVIEDMHKSLV